MPKINNVQFEEIIGINDLTNPTYPGELQSDVVNDAINYTKMMRYTAGLPIDLVPLKDISEEAQAAAYVNAINGDISHTPSKPSFISEKLFELAARGSNGNLSYFIGPTYKSVQNYMDDLGHSNLLSVGHRLKILDPLIRAVGFGHVMKSTAVEIPYAETTYFTEGYSAMHAYHHFGNVSFEKVITWPAHIVMPLEFSEHWASWSVSFNDSPYLIDLDAIEVTVTLNGETQVINKRTTEYFTEGFNSTLIFKPNFNEPFQHGDHAKVVVTGLKTPDGKDTTYRFETTFLSLNK